MVENIVGKGFFPKPLKTRYCLENGYMHSCYGVLNLEGYMEETCLRIKYIFTFLPSKSTQKFLGDTKQVSIKTIPNKKAKMALDHSPEFLRGP